MFNFKNMSIRYCTIALLLLANYSGYAQQEVVDLPDLANIKLPTLEVLFENAKKSPGVEMYEAKMESQDNLLTTEQRSWLKYFKVGGSYQYGNIAVNSAFTNENTPLFMQTTGQVQNSWYGTAGINVPLDDLFDRKNRVKRQKIERRFTELEMEKWLDEQRIRITESYMRVKLHLSTLRKKVEEYSIAEANFKMVQNEFKIGAASVSDLNIAKKQETEAHDRLRINEFDMLNEVIKLEILSKTKIISN